MAKRGMNLSELMSDLVVICRRNGFAVERYRLWRVRMTVATWLFRAAAAVAGMRFEMDEEE
jgi:hypothetical protein